MNVRLIIENIIKDDESCFADFIYNVIDKMISEESDRKVDSVVINYHTGEEVKIK